MVVYRIEREKFLKTTLSGIGASLSDEFRWNTKHTRMVYTSESRALALLEISVHLNIHLELPNDRYVLEIDIPEKLNIMSLPLNELPGNWDCKPPGKLTQVVGDQFISDGKAPVLKVPSCIVPFEYNYLINPLHPDAKKITLLRNIPLRFDSRIKQ